MRSKTLALVSPRSSSMSTDPLVESAELAPLADSSEAANQTALQTSTHSQVAPASPPSTGPTVAPPLWSSEQLLAGAEEAAISHGDQIYRLRRTLTGKLILTK